MAAQPGVQSETLACYLAYLTATWVPRILKRRALRVSRTRRHYLRMIMCSCQSFMILNERLVGRSSEEVEPVAVRPAW
jgi:hypothetical protein